MVHYGGASVTNSNAGRMTGLEDRVTRQLGIQGHPGSEADRLLIQWLFGAYDCLVRDKQRYFESIRLHELASIPQTLVGKCLVRFPAMLAAYFRVSRCG